MPAPAASAHLWVGCSGWQYKHWRNGVFYPADVPQTRWLEYYATQFNTVEINNSFYRLPTLETFKAWERRAPAGFVYAVKASRFLTHMKKLKDPVEPLHRLFSHARGLGRSFGPVLYQLPPRWAVDLERFEIFLRALPPTRRHAIEFREPSWYCEEVFALMQRHSVALCLHDMAGSATGMTRVGPFVYVRFHGPHKYSGRYDDGTLERWAAWMREQLAGELHVFAYFNNDIGGHAPRDAVRLRTLIAAGAGSRFAPR
jgi:uncharacterized protein YecE (DUF72 family)